VIVPPLVKKKASVVDVEDLYRFQRYEKRGSWWRSVTTQV
jgi:hypothetical protein